MNLERLKRIAELGDDEALWRYWKEMERLGLIEWKTSQLPKLKELSVRLAEMTHGYRWLRSDFLPDPIPVRMHYPFVVMSFSLDGHKWHLSDIDERTAKEWSRPHKSFLWGCVISAPYKTDRDDHHVVASHMLKDIFYLLKRETDIYGDLA
jgi:hypothetical protein